MTNTNNQKTMKKLLFAALCLLFASCAGTPAPIKEQTETDDLSLGEAIEQSADTVAGDLPPGSRVAIVAFDSENDNLSGYIMEELTGALVERKLEVVDRQNLEYVYKELNFQMSGDVSDESAQSIGKFLGAQLVITGALIKAGGRYRYRVNAIHVEQATRNSSIRLDVRNDRELEKLIADLAEKKTSASTAKELKAAKTFLDRGILFASRGEYGMAIEDFDEAVKLDPKMTMAYVLRGRALIASISHVDNRTEDFNEITFSGLKSDAPKERIDEALADYNQAIKLDPNYAFAYYNRGIAYYDKKDYDRAIADYNQAIKLDPNYAAAYSSRGNAYRAKGDYDRAIADYNQAIKLDPNYAAAYNNRGFAYDSKGDYDRAIADHTQAIKLDPNYAVAYRNRGNAYRAKKDYDRAIADYNQAIKLDPDYALAYNNRGSAYYDKKDYDRAIADHTQAIKLDPNLAAAYKNRGSAYANKKDYDRAIADYNQAIKLDPQLCFRLLQSRVCV